MGSRKLTAIGLGLWVISMSSCMDSEMSWTSLNPLDEEEKSPEELSNEVATNGSPSTSSSTGSGSTSETSTSSTASSIPVSIPASFSCDSGSLSDTCVVSTPKHLADASVISGPGSLTLSNGGVITCPVESLCSIIVGGTVRVESGAYIHANLELLKASDLVVDSGGYIKAFGKGLITGGGMGMHYTAATQSGAGGGHAAIGGNGAGGRTGGTAYGSSSDPTSMGSGGGYGASGVPGGRGGGRIKIVISSTATINGDVSANGTEGTANSSGGAGGGAGGSVWIKTLNLAGSGQLQVLGGNGGSGAYFGGGGGAGYLRVCIESGSTYSGGFATNGGSGFMSGNSTSPIFACP